MLPQPAAGHSRIAAGEIRLARRPTASAVNAPPSAAGRLAPRGSTAAAAAAPSNATKTAARRPSSRLPDRPKRPEQAPAGDRSHRRIDAATSRVRAPRAAVAWPGCAPPAKSQTTTLIGTPQLCRRGRPQCHSRNTHPSSFAAPPCNPEHARDARTVHRSTSD